LLAAVPKLGNANPLVPVESEELLLDVNDLSVRFPLNRTLFSREYREVRAVENISFNIRPGETLGLVGESGCGKSTTGRALMNLLSFEGSAKLDGTELNGLKGRELKAIRKDIQMVFQDPYASLNSRKTIFDLLVEPIVLHNIVDKAQSRDYVAHLLEQVGLAADVMSRFPHQFSGGQRQRISIARAIASQPKLIIADESVSALDVSVQAQVIELLNSLQKQLGVSYLFVSHDMAVVEQISHRVAVMHCGKIVEMGPRDQVMQQPKHPYTQRLMQAVPIAEVRPRRDLSLVLNQYETPDPICLSSQPISHIKYESDSLGHKVAVSA
jgi:peptide/nickel transport system ATP-binding protein